MKWPSLSAVGRWGSGHWKETRVSAWWSNLNLPCPSLSRSPEFLLLRSLSQIPLRWAFPLRLSCWNSVFHRRLLFLRAGIRSLLGGGRAWLGRQPGLPGGRGQPGAGSRSQVGFHCPAHRTTLGPAVGLIQQLDSINPISSTALIGTEFCLSANSE